MKVGREIKDIIIFKDNPWPEGHKITEFVWSGRIEPESGVWFDFHLETEDYYEGDEDYFKGDAEEEEEGDESNWKLIDWKSKITWGNYHSCILSSTYWEEEKGFLIGTKEDKLDFNRLVGKKIIVDPLETYNPEEPAFHIYLLGHDSAADHHIHFYRQISHDEFSISWKGKIAMSYLYDDEFDFSFEANISKAKFEGIFLPKELSVDEAYHLLSQFVKEPQRFQLTMKNDKPCFVLAG